MSDKRAVSVVKKIPAAVWLGLIIILAVIRLCYLFSLRDGHHVDETWSYGYANSYYMPHVFGGYSEETEKNIGEWITGDVFKDYITVAEDQRFSFDSVMFNKKDDLSPVLYAFILHFICSLFPGQFSWGFAFFVSLLFYVPSIILMFVLSREITKKDIVGYISVVYYVFSGTGTGNFLYLRVYHIFTFFTLLLFFLIHRIIRGEDKKKWISYLLLPVATILGCLTHYYFLVMAFGLTLFGALIILCRKRLRDAFRVCYVQLLSVIAFFLIYSPALAKLMPYSTGETSGTGYYHYPYYFDLAVANVHFFQDTIGWFIQFTVFDVLYVFGLIILVAIMIALVWFVLRNEERVKKFTEKVKNGSWTAWKYVRSFFSCFTPSIYVAILSSLFFMFVIPYSATLVNMGFVDRYFFPAMSLFLVAYLSFIGVIVVKIHSSSIKKIISVLLTVLMVILLAFLNYRTNQFTDVFQFRNWNEQEMYEQVSGKDVYLVINANRDMVFLSTILYDADNVYINYQTSFDEDDFVVPELGPDCILMIVDEGLMSEDQKSEFLENSTFTLNGLMKPDAFFTVDELVEKIESDTGKEYDLIGRYLNFLGYISIYKGVDSSS